MTSSSTNPPSYNGLMLHFSATRGEEVEIEVRLA
jgi:hypothetical protein